MKAGFELGAVVRFVVPGAVGALARITAQNPMPYGWKMPGYVGEGLYHVTTIGDRRNLIVREDDLVLEHVDATESEGGS